MPAVVLNYARAAQVLSIPRAAVDPIAYGLDIEPKEVPHNGKAKGLDLKDLAKMARFLKRQLPVELSA